ncbi:alanine racemase [Aerococcus sp. HMSC10H05]|uniref:alanine racemase n=1 Tax=Aerococcus sp. HMSC10H05 TaxID=1581084 RepID=UPI0008A3C0A6|nr:alanine racemase [Aerococcus sp. HMSC10H05]OFU52158.1 alanine racemase [Aerococcus sp. HMSC10H05]
MTIGYHRPSKAIVSLDAIIHNYFAVKKHVGNKAVMAVIKANAYGLGAVEIADALQARGVDGFAVALADEAIALRDAGMIAPIMVLGLTDPDDAWLLANLEIGVTVSSLDYLKYAKKHDEDFSRLHKLNVHLKIDSGMGRIGVRTVKEAQKIINYIAKHPKKFKLASIFTHYATADSFTDHSKDKVSAQSDFFDDILSQLDYSALGYTPLFHQSNSALSVWHPEKALDAVRLGIGLYGSKPSMEDVASPVDFQQALTLETEIIYVKKMHAGDTISYGAEYTASEDEWVATLPIGYADGWQRSYLGLNAIVDGELCPSVGRICMDQMIIRLPHEMPVGTKVTLIGTNGGQTIDVIDVAHHAGTIAHEVLTNLSPRLPREYTLTKKKKMK